MAHVIAATPLPTAALSPAQLAAVGFLARYTGPTHEVYRHYLDRWWNWCENQGIDPLLEVARPHVELYVRTLVNQGLKPTSVRTALAPVRGLFKFAYLDGVIPRDPAAYIRLPKVTYTPKAPFDRDDLRAFIAAARAISPRHHAAAHLLAVMGMRASEACSIDVPDVFHSEQGYRVLRYTGKGDKPAATPIPYQSIPILEAACAGRTEGPLLTTLHGRRLTRHALAGIVETTGRRAGFVRKVNPHLLRAAAVTLGLDAGLDLRAMQDYARHADPRTTRQHYDLHRNDYATHAVHTIGARLAV